MQHVTGMRQRPLNGSWACTGTFWTGYNATDGFRSPWLLPEYAPIMRVSNPVRVRAFSAFNGFGKLFFFFCDVGLHSFYVKYSMN